MSTELDRKLTQLYQSLGTETQYAPLPTPEVLRRRGDRRTLSRATLAAAAAAVLVTGVAFGGNELLGRDDSQITPAPPGPSGSPSVSPSVSPSASPSVSPSASPSATKGATPTAPATQGAKPPPTSVPNSAFLTAAEINDSAMTDSDQGVQFPDLCGRGPVSDPRPELVRARTGFIRQPGVPFDNVPDASLHHSVARYVSTARAHAWMLDLEDAVLSCPRRAQGTRGGETLYRLLPNPPAIADQVLFIEERIRAFDAIRDEFSDNYTVVYTVAIRHGDAVTVIYTQPFEDFGFTGPERMRQLATIAAERLETWRGAVAAGP
jgi:hypothetical protein